MSLSHDPSGERLGREDWLDTLRSSDWLVYLTVAGSRGEMGGEAISAFLEAMGGGDETLRDRASFFLTHFDLPGLIPALVARLADEGLRRQAIHVLSEVGPKHEAELLASINGTSKNTRWWVALAMLESLQDAGAEEGFRAAATRVYRHLGPIVIPPCLSMLRGEDREARKTASYALLAVGPGAVTPLVDLLDDDTAPAPARADAAYTLGEIGHLEGDELPGGMVEIAGALLSALDDDDPLVSRSAEMALDRIESGEADGPGPP